MPGTGPGASLEPSTHHPEAISEIDWPYTFLGDTETEPANWGKNSTDADKTHHPTQMKPASCSVSYLGNTDVSVHERFDIILSKGEEGGIRWQIAGVEVSLRAFELPLGAKKGAKADEARKKWKHSWELIPEGLGCQLFVKHCSEATKLANDAEWWICRIDIEKDSKKVTYKANDGVKVEVEYRTNTPTLGRKPVKLPNPRKEDEAKDERRLPSVPMA
ncbi:hypothetical protein QFC24_006240 [Naganishia onofrii]|uniref:Uncharacterized protein n=1 Tax=Naganishia onofrii TaxID=1851511 RepID=A0ACC2X4R6_9TREE|nr:hypothetical protein QFC24_006240 [Naganishia onofrii]